MLSPCATAISHLPWLRHAAWQSACKPACHSCCGVLMLKGVESLRCATHALAGAQEHSGKQESSLPDSWVEDAEFVAAAEAPIGQQGRSGQAAAGVSGSIDSLETAVMTFAMAQGVVRQTEIMVRGLTLPSALITLQMALYRCHSF